MPSKYRAIVNLSQQEKAFLEKKSKELNMSMSKTIRHLLGIEKVTSKETLQNINKLMKINADLARLGNLFKLAIDEVDQDLTPFIDNIQETSDLLKSEIKNINRK